MAYTLIVWLFMTPAATYPGWDGEVVAPSMMQIPQIDALSCEMVKEQMTVVVENLMKIKQISSYIVACVPSTLPIPPFIPQLEIPL